MVTAKGSEIVKSRCVPPAIIGVVGIALCWLSWRRWPDVLIDFGRELYVPWRLAEGDVLYTDVAWLYGPLSPYVNALLFKLFGPSLSVLMWSNLLLTAALTAVIYYIFVRWTSRALATICCVTFLCLFAFAHLQPVGNYNFICPYSHSLTHGVFLSFICLLALWKYLERRRGMWLMCHNLCFGLVLLTKLEVFVACAAAVVVGWILLALRHRPSAGGAARLILQSGLFFAIPTVAFTLLLARERSYSEALKNIFFSWSTLFNTSVADTHFHRLLMGTDRPLVSIGQVLMISVVYVLALAAVCGLNGAVASRRARSRSAGLCLAVIIVGVAVWLMDGSHWLHLFRPLPVLMIAVAIGLVSKVTRRGAAAESSRQTTELLIFTTFCFALLLKIIFRVHLYTYGFALAMPASILAVVVVLDWLVRWAHLRYGGAALVAVAVWSSFGCTLLWYGRTTATYYWQKTEPFATGPDIILTNAADSHGRNRIMIKAAQFIEQRFRPEDRFVVFPEGVMLNYVTRRPSGIAFYNFVPSVLAVYGEDAILQALDKNPPEYVIQCSRQAVEFGARFFGIDYGPRLAEWIDAHYLPVEQFGRWPPLPDRFGLIIMKKTN